MRARLAAFRTASARVVAAVLLLGCGVHAGAGAAPTGAADAPTAAADAPVKSPLTIGDSWQLHSAVLDETRRINVYAPPGYDARDAAALPVLYMLDGGLAEDFVHVAGLVQVGAGNGTMRPFLLVGIENTVRRRDLVGPTDVPEEKKIAPQAGGTEKFRRFVRTELMPFVREHYRTTNESAVVGESFAGLFVVETFLHEPTLFDTYIAFDASLWWNRGRLLADAPRLLRQHDRVGRTLFLAASREDIDDGNARLDRVLDEGANTGVTHFFVSMPKETHATVFHPAALTAFRRVLAPRVDAGADRPAAGHSAR